MKIIGKIITGLAAFTFVLSLCMMDADPVAAFFMMFVSGCWIAGYCYIWEEKRLKEEKR